MGTPEAVTVRHLHLDPTLGQYGQPALTETAMAAAPRNVSLGPRATMVLQYNLSAPVVQNETSIERKFYAEPLSTAAPFRFTGQTLTARIINVTVPGAGGEAMLRIGGQFWHSAISRRDPRNVIAINNHTLGFPDQFMGEGADIPERWFGVLMVPVPVEYLSADNVVTCTVIQNNVYTTAALQTWEFSAPPGR